MPSKAMNKMVFKSFKTYSPRELTPEKTQILIKIHKILEENFGGAAVIPTRTLRRFLGTHLKIGRKQKRIVLWYLHKLGLITYGKFSSIINPSKQFLNTTQKPLKLKLIKERKTKKQFRAVISALERHPNKKFGGDGVDR